MNRSACLTRLLVSLLLLSVGATLARAEDDRLHNAMFEPAPEAAEAINFDGRGFLIHGKRTFIASGGMEYARIPRALWRDRLLRLKRAGFNCVEIYTLWNYHEPRSGQFDFKGDKDLDAFLKLAKSLDLYAIVRVGPYYCAEWDGGGYPVWLRFVPGLRVREANPQFLAAVDRFWEHLLPIVAANQIHHGGSVILVQLENEHLQGAGREISNAYFAHLRDKAVSLGLQVPYFFSGLHHGGDPAGDRPWSSQGQLSPWITTEFWSINFDRYGQTLADANIYDRRMWKVLAYGGNGLNFYMFHGGTNFGSWNNDEDASSYDYGSAIGQAGDLRPTFYRFKRAALFAHSFASVLEDSDNATDAYRDAATDASVRVTARQSPAGTLLFLDNNGKGPLKTQVKETDGRLFPSSGPLTLFPSQILPIISDYALLPGMTLERSTPLLGILPQGNTITLVAWGLPGDPVEMRFHGSDVVTPATGVEAFTRETSGALTLKTTIPVVGTHTYSFRQGQRTVRVIAVNRDTSDRTWFVDNNIVIGPEFVGDASMRDGHLKLITEWANGPAIDGLVYGAQADPEHLRAEGSRLPLPSAPTLSVWQMRHGDDEAQPGFWDAAWKASADPLPMGADGDYGAYAWYRTTVTVPKAGTYSLRLTDAADWLSVFVGGRHAVSSAARLPLRFALQAGSNALAILTTHYGRAKLFGYMGPFDKIDVKGLDGPVVLDLDGGSGQAITTWRVKNDNAPDKAAPPTDASGKDWRAVRLGEDPFGGKRGFAWYRAELPASPGAHHRLHFDMVDDNGTIYLNGKLLRTHIGYSTSFDVPLDAAWREGGPNELAVLVENTDGPGGISGTVALQAVAAGDEVAIHGWKMRGGLDYPTPGAHWTEGPGGTANGSPTFYRATFDAATISATGPHPILRVTTTGLSRGFVWLNGHNLGRYPEKIPIDGLYLPECWLKTRHNELVVFDEAGHTPAQVKLWVEQAASRVVVPMTAR